ncbi:EAL and HDOD domain-containing protein [Thiomicrorhabdus aquaedulcis]|uniref:EAL and HDOD domain-containing protein n=1 Tax=Thiomicrorhabdus aquaedulcis TaxID=2211106 RepID=UPI000FD97787|nr:HDOD domain-containing protein [Thiomicrorhabdus aquaedulcis]
MQHHLLLNQQPILNAQKQLYAYQLTLEKMPGIELNAEQWENELTALCDSLRNHIGLESLGSGKPVFYRAPAAFLRLALLPKVADLNHLMVEIGLEVLKDTVTLNALKEMMQAGVKIAVANYLPTAEHDKLLSIAKTVKINAAQINPVQASYIITKLKDKGVNAVISGLEEEDAFVDYLAAGADYFQGYFFTNPIVSAQKQIASNQLAMLKLLAEVNNPEASFENIVAIVGSDVGLTHKLLAAINHPSNGLAKVIETLKDAVTFMGLKRLKFWVNMMMLSEIDDVPMALLTTALVRAKFLETMAEVSGVGAQKERYFMVGLFSTLNAFLKAPMADIVDHLPLSAEIKLALLQQTASAGGVMGGHLPWCARLNRVIPSFLCAAIRAWTLCKFLVRI